MLPPLKSYLHSHKLPKIILFGYLKIKRIQSWEFYKLVMEKFHWSSLCELASLAPHLSEDTLDKLALQTDFQKDINGIVALAPFLSEDTLDKLVLQADLQKNMNGLVALAPFLGDKTLKELARRLIQKKDLNGLKTLTPYI